MTGAPGASKRTVEDVMSAWNSAVGSVVTSMTASSAMASAVAKRMSKSLDTVDKVSLSSFLFASTTSIEASPVDGTNAVVMVANGSAGYAVSNLFTNQLLNSALAALTDDTSGGKWKPADTLTAVTAADTVTINLLCRFIHPGTTNSLTLGFSIVIAPST